MEKLACIKDGFQNGAHRPSLTSSSSQRDVSYSVLSYDYQVVCSHLAWDSMPQGRQAGLLLRNGARLGFL
ncbi:hypothetical protein L484_004388 [Morus notabilis]|uniref:Uncharacterized protein n=1 Tax=Morus notabilis TaxID=981085 RepID=W9S1X5_9ROSA|nr:hypothetical protein L484_004388 [Morus notabilis]